eukprot:gnl/TRDRNA2_/TRDRNA2_178090_c0_seq12.p2 gnl/TRDRNA2_/TRDRNA2_178090_c0~~gnl/TRDRNA2_/TRDRNA2_178090_c0_seq12.p2  ORF type:complete len:110 (+),score=7.00 gnl/TRDRNA2_/TRDRNA2_178090_c0_seq12:205-534(+)
MSPPYCTLKICNILKFRNWTLRQLLVRPLRMSSMHVAFRITRPSVFDRLRNLNLPESFPGRLISIQKAVGDSLVPTFESRQPEPRLLVSDPPMYIKPSVQLTTLVFCDV